MDNIMQPFGEVSFETEIGKLGSRWEEYFFGHTYFVRESLNTDTYLIIGRRGSGKSSLSEFFSHQKKYKNSTSINIGESKGYLEKLFEIAREYVYSSELAKRKLVEVWTFLMWAKVFEHSVQYDSSLNGLVEDGDIHSIKNIVTLLFEGVVEKYVTSTAKELIQTVNYKLRDGKFLNGIDASLVITRKKPIFLLIDSWEHYNKNNELEMWITSALIEAASNFNARYSSQGIHVKVGIADEIFPYIEERHIANPSKHIRNPLYLYWRPKDLVRLLCWRYFKFLKIKKLTLLSEDQIDWESFEDIYSKIWVCYFGEYILNRRGVKEKTLPYVLRHTHLRPRQLVIICNKIAYLASNSIKFDNQMISAGITASEIPLANELLNSYSEIYPNCGEIISALQGFSIEFRPSDLDRFARRSASQWQHAPYSLYEFTRLITELGIIGRKQGDTDQMSGIIKANFEYTMPDRMYISNGDTCVIHPMFYSKLNINRNNPSNCCVYPFPDHPDFNVLKLI